MKNMIELPTEKDFHKTTIITVQEPRYMGLPPKESELVCYHKGALNMRNVVDLLENEITGQVLDESKLEAYKKEMAEYRKRHQMIADIEDHSRQLSIEPSDEMSALDIPPSPPTKEFKLKCTVVLYFNGVQRLIVDDYAEFEEKYFNYLTSQKLDM